MFQHDPRKVFAVGKNRDLVSQVIVLKRNHWFSVSLYVGHRKCFVIELVTKDLCVCVLFILLFIFILVLYVGHIIPSIHSDCLTSKDHVALTPATETEVGGNCLSSCLSYAISHRLSYRQGWGGRVLRWGYIFLPGWTGEVR